MAAKRTSSTTVKARRRASEPDLTEIGAVGLRSSSGVTFDEFLPELQGRRAVKIYQEMASNDAVIGAILYAIRTSLTGAGWRVEPARDSGETGKAVADFFWEVLNDMEMTFQDTLSEILTFLEFGWSAHEPVLKRRVGPNEDDRSRRSRFTDGRIGLRSIAPRPQETLSKWVFDDVNDELVGMEQRRRRGGAVTIPRDRLLLFRTRSRNGHPEGVSLLRTAYRSWVLLKTAQEAEMIGIERGFAGIPVFRVPKETMLAKTTERKAELDAYSKMAAGIRFNSQAGMVLSNELIVDPKTGEATDKYAIGFELESTAGQTRLDTVAIKRGYQGDMARALMAQFMMLGQTSSGSFALSDSQTKTFANAVTAIGEQTKAPINYELFPMLMACNGLPAELTPTLEHGEIDPASLDELGAYVRDISAAGINVSDDETANMIRQRAGLPNAPVGAAPATDRGPRQPDEPRGDDG